jgi:hypothetical protein
LCRDQFRTFLMDDVDEGAPPQQTLVPRILADVGTALRAWHKISVSIPSSRGDGVIPLPVECILP